MKQLRNSQQRNIKAQSNNTMRKQEASRNFRLQKYNNRNKNTLERIDNR